MKRLRKLLCLAIATLWVLPVSATEFNQHSRGVLDQTGLAPVLKSFEPMSEWIAVTEDEYLEFDSAEYQVQFEMINAVWDSSSDKELVIEAFDETGVSLATGGPYDYVVSTAFIPNVLTIASGDQTPANNFVRGLPSTQPDTRRIQIRPTLILDQVQDCDQQVTMRTWFRYDNALVGTDRPDHLVIPSVLLNSC